MSRRCPVMSKETAWYPRVWLFGHYDSRGGCAAIVGKENLSEAKKAYAECLHLGYGEEERVWARDMANGDLMTSDVGDGSWEVVFVDTPPPQEGEDVLYGRHPECEPGAIPVVDLEARNIGVILIISEKGMRERGWEQDAGSCSPGEVQIAGEVWKEAGLGEDAYGLIWDPK